MGTDFESPLSFRDDSSAARRARPVVSENNASRPLDAKIKRSRIDTPLLQLQQRQDWLLDFFGKESKAILQGEFKREMDR
jgi:hypothetical protein